MQSIVPTLVRLTSALAVAGMLAAVEGPAGGGTVIAPGSGTVRSEQGPSVGQAPSALGRLPGFGGQAERDVVIKGLIDLDYLNQQNYTDGSSDHGDSVQDGRIRSELGVKIEFDDKLKVVTTLAYQGRMGDTTPADPSATENGAQVVLDDAYVVLKSFLGYSSLSMILGRQPVSWNLRKNYGAFLFDSRADHNDITSWDGGSGRFGIADAGVTLSPYAYVLPDRSRLYGITGDWQVDAAGSGTRFFLTTSANVQYDLKLRDNTIADNLQTYYLGMEWTFDTGVDFFAEGAMQRGTQTGDVIFRGYGMSTGLEWRPQTPFQTVFGVQLDLLSGDQDPADSRNRAFINPFEGVSDTYIVESEKYGELSRGLQGDLRAAKIKAEVAFDSANRLRLRAVYGYYQLDQAAIISGQDVGKNFGQEIDLGLIWQYTTNARISLIGGAFLPKDGYRAATRDPVTAGTDAIYLFAANLLVSF